MHRQHQHDIWWIGRDYHVMPDGTLIPKHRHPETWIDRLSNSGGTKRIKLFVATVRAVFILRQSRLAMA